MKQPIQTVNIRARLPIQTNEWLRERAQMNLRSVNAELLCCIEAAKREVEEQEANRARKRT